MIKKCYALAAVFLLFGLPATVLPCQPAARPEPCLLESKDGALRFAMLPEDYSVAMGGEIYNHSGLYHAAVPWRRITQKSGGGQQRVAERLLPV